MKKAIMIALALSLCIGCSACAGNSTTSESSAVRIENSIGGGMESIIQESKDDSSEESTEESAEESVEESTEESTSTGILPGTTESFNGISLTVPEGMGFDSGESPTGESYVTVYKEGESYLHVTIFCISDVNEPIDPRDNSVELSDYNVNGTEWNGISFDDAGDPGATIIGVVNGQAFYVEDYGFAYDSDVMTTLLSTLTYSA